MYMYFVIKLSSYELEWKFLVYFIKEDKIFSYINLLIYLVIKSFVMMK